LKHSAIQLKDVDYEIIWSRNKSLGRYTTRLGYEVRMEEEYVGEKK